MIKNIVSKIDSKAGRQTSKSFDFYLTIIDSVIKHQKLPGGILSKQALNWYVKKLRIDGVISKLGYGVWQVNHDNFDRWAFKKQVKVQGRGTHPCSGKQVKVFNGCGVSDIGIKEHIRGHGFQWTLKLPIGVLDSWRGRSQILARLGFACKVFKSGRGQTLLFEGHKVDLWDKCVVFYSPRDKSYFASSAVDCRQFALFDIDELVGRFERALGVSFRSQGKFALKFVKQHYADVNNELARQRSRDNKPLRVPGWSGEWLLVDCSLGVPELECVHPVSSVSDMDDVVVPFFNDLKETRLMPSMILEMVGGVTRNQEMFAENMRSHIKAVQDLGSGVQDLTKAVKAVQDQVRDDRLDRVRKLKAEWGW
jgi:hypothetical protein